MTELNVVEKPYRARTHEQLRLVEFRKVAGLMINDGKAISEIRQMSKEENFLNASSPARAADVLGSVIRRIQSVDEDYLRFFLEQNADNQKILAYTAMMTEDHTFFDFNDVVVKEKMRLNDMELTDADILGFLRRLQDSHQEIGWTDASVKKMVSNWKVVLKDAGLLKTADGKGKYTLVKPVLSKEFTDFLDKDGLGRMADILTGR